MKRIAAAMLVLALPMGAAAAAAFEASAKPTLQVGSQQPLVIDGRGFKRLELVKVAVTAGDEHGVKRVRARSGAFSATFAAVRYDPCHDVLAVRAIGSKGSTASLKVLTRECPLP